MIKERNSDEIYRIACQWVKTRGYDKKEIIHFVNNWRLLPGLRKIVEESCVERTDIVGRQCMVCGHEWFGRENDDCDYCSGRLPIILLHDPPTLVNIIDPENTEYRVIGYRVHEKETELASEILELIERYHLSEILK